MQSENIVVLIYDPCLLKSVLIYLSIYLYNITTTTTTKLWIRHCWYTRYEYKSTYLKYAVATPYQVPMIHNQEDAMRLTTLKVRQWWWWWWWRRRWNRRRKLVGGVENVEKITKKFQLAQRRRRLYEQRRRWVGVFLTQPPRCLCGEFQISDVLLLLHGFSWHPFALAIWLKGHTLENAGDAFESGAQENSLRTQCHPPSEFEFRFGPWTSADLCKSQAWSISWCIPPLGSLLFCLPLPTINHEQAFLWISRSP